MKESGELTVTGEEVFRMAKADPLAALVREGTVTNDINNFETAMGCSLYAEGSGWVYPRAPRTTTDERAKQLVATFPLPTTTLDLAGTSHLYVSCSYDGSEQYAPPVGERSFAFSSKGCSFTGVSVLEPSAQDAHTIKARTRDSGTAFHIYLDRDGTLDSGIAMAADSGEGGSHRNVLVLVLAAVGLGFLASRYWISPARRFVAYAVTLASGATGYVLATSDYSFSGYESTPGAYLTSVSFAWWSLLLPALLVIAVHRRPGPAGRVPPSRRLKQVTAAPFAALPGAVAAVFFRFGDTGASSFTLAVAAAGTVVAPCLLTQLVGQGWRIGAAFGVLLFTGLWTASLMSGAVPDTLTFTLAIGCSLVWAAALSYTARRLTGPPTSALVACALTAALCLVPLKKYLSWTGDDAPFRARIDALTTAYGLMGLAALTATVMTIHLLFRRGGGSEAVRDDATRVAGVLLVGLSISPLLAGFSFMASDVIACVIGVLAFWLLLPQAKADAAFRLSRISPGAYVRLMRLEARNRVYRQAWTRYHKSASGSLGAAETEAAEFEQKWNELAERAMPSRKRRPTFTSPALSSSAARTPLRNALDVGILGLVFAIPVVIMDLRSWEWLFPEMSLAQLLTVVLHMLRWVVYGAFYGYFYTRLPGHLPVVKSTFFFLAILLPELILIPLSTPYTTRDAITVLLLRTGAVVVFCYGLGLSWEIRLARLAGMPWNGLRDLRRLSTVTAPAITVIVAVATTVATALAGAATVAMLQSGPETPAAPATPPASPTPVTTPSTPPSGTPSGTP